MQFAGEVLYGEDRDIELHCVQIAMRSAYSLNMQKPVIYKSPGYTRNAYNEMGAFRNELLTSKNHNTSGKAEQHSSLQTDLIDIS